VAVAELLEHFLRMVAEGHRQTPVHLVEADVLLYKDQILILSQLEQEVALVDQIQLPPII
jgi:hypothetical protein